MLMFNEIEKIEIAPLVEINIGESMLPEKVKSQMQKAIAVLEKINGLPNYFKIKNLNKTHRDLICSLLLANYEDEPKAGIILVGGFAFLKKDSYFFGFEGGIPTFTFTKGWGQALTKLTQQESVVRFFSGNDGGYSLRRQGDIVIIRSYNEQKKFCDISHDKLLTEWNKADAEYNGFSALLKQELLVRLEKKIPEHLMIHTF